MRLLLLVPLVYVGLGVVLVLSRNRIIFPVRDKTSGRPDQFHVGNAIEVNIPTGDGAVLAGWLLQPVPPRDGPTPVLVWFHGNAETVAALASELTAFRPPGVAVLAVDYRG